MAALPPPEGLTEDDYDAIHAAVVETVRGRWFLSEYARRNRVEEVQEMLAAIGRLETVVISQRSLPPPETSPHNRLLTQRADEIAIRLADIIEDLRETGADAYLCDELDSQARAIAGLPKGAASEPQQAMPQVQRAMPAEVKPALEAPSEKLLEKREERAQKEALKPPGERLQERFGEQPKGEFKEQPKSRPEDLPAPELPQAPALPRAAPLQVRGDDEPALAALAALDRLSLAEKLAFFS